jgi:hypothetical protein
MTCKRLKIARLVDPETQHQKDGSNELGRLAFGHGKAAGNACSMGFASKNETRHCPTRWRIALELAATRDNIVVNLDMKRVTGACRRWVTMRPVKRLGGNKPGPVEKSEWFGGSGDLAWQLSVQ